MKLRNKKTGEVVVREELILTKYYEGDGCWTDRKYTSIAELNEDWEDYIPKEPLIKDEKVRKAVRAWAEANDFTRVWYEYDYSNDVAVFMVGETKMIIKADELLRDRTKYTIAELCGEENR